MTTPVAVLQNRYTIRPAWYRGQAGFTIRGKGPGLFGTKVFTLSRSSAEHIKRKLLAGKSIEVPDFEEQAS